MDTESKSSSFISGVNLEIIGNIANPEKIRASENVRLRATFHDFLGEITRQTGSITASTNLGTLISGSAGQRISELGLGPEQLDENNGLDLILKPGGSYGTARVTVSCELGTKSIELKFMKPAGFALTEVMESIIYAFMFAIIIRILFFQTFWIPTGSMEPTLYQGDRIVVNKLLYRMRTPVRGEVVVFRVFQPHPRSGTASLTLDEAMASLENTVDRFPFLREDMKTSGEEGWVEVQDYIKRVVGLPGDTVEVRDGVILVNGEPLVETFETRPPDYRNFGPVTVPPGEIFVLGDNRSNSQDSHVIGTIPLRNIEGRAELIFWPPARINAISSGN